MYLIYFLTINIMLPGLIHRLVFIPKHLSVNSFCLRLILIVTSSTDWAQLSMFHLKTETKSRLRNIVFCDKNRAMDKTQKYDICINIASLSSLLYCVDYVFLKPRHI
jgi:hypothetical protein